MILQFEEKSFDEDKWRVAIESFFFRLLVKKTSSGVVGVGAVVGEVIAYRRGMGSIPAVTLFLFIPTLNFGLS